MSQKVAALVCPECGSEEPHKDGTRKLSDGTEKQRYICRRCMYRYTLPTSLNCVNDNLAPSQIRANQQVKNLRFAQKYHDCADDVRLSPDIRGLITRFYGYLENNAYSGDTAYPRIIRQLALKGVNLLEPENVKSTIARLTFKDRKTKEIKKVSNGTKAFYCSAYAAFCAMLKIPFYNPGYKQKRKRSVCAL